MKSIAWAIHDLNFSGGHERSTREIIQYLFKKYDVNICTYDFFEKKQERTKKFIFFVKPKINSVDAVKVIYFFLASIVFLILLKLKYKNPPIFISTGTASLYSKIVQVQFVNAAWRDKKKIFPPDAYFDPGVRGSKTLLRSLKKIYQSILLEFHVWVENKVYTNKKHYIAISESVKAELEKYFSVKKISVIHHGVNTDIFFPHYLKDNNDRTAIRKALNISESATLLIFVGALERKGLAKALEAYASLSSEHRSNTNFLILGSGSIDSFKEMTHRLGIQEHCIFLGNKNNIEAYYRASDIFVLPTLYEPFGLVIIEAMASGLAIITSKLAGASELIKHGESGLLIEDPTSSSEIANFMQLVLEDNEMRSKLQKNSFEIAKNNSWENVAKKYEFVIDQYN